MNVRGWVYVLTNRAMPDLVKIGYSMKDPVLRAKELNHTGSPHPYEVAFDVLAVNPREIEQRVHSALDDRLEGKEWFRCSTREAAAKIRAVGGAAIILEGAMAEQTWQSATLSKPRDDSSLRRSCAWHGKEKCNQSASSELDGVPYCDAHFKHLWEARRDPRKQKWDRVREQLAREVERNTRKP